MRFGLISAKSTTREGAVAGRQIHAARKASDSAKVARRLHLPPLALLPLVSSIALSSSPVHAQNPAEGSPLYDPLAFPLSTETSIAPIDPRLWEFKKALLDLGYNFQVNYTGEVAANPVGGAQQGADYEGLLELGIDGDLNRIAGLKGASFHINAFAIHGRGLTTYNIFNFSTISGIEARPNDAPLRGVVRARVFRRPGVNPYRTAGGGHRVSRE